MASQDRVDPALGIEEPALRELESVRTLEGLDEWRVMYLGRRGRLTQLLRGIGSLPSEERRRAGAEANRVKTVLDGALADRQAELKRAEADSLAQDEKLDVTLPGWPMPAGGLHPTTQMVREVCSAFGSMGFQVVEGPEAGTRGRRRPC